MLITIEGHSFAGKTTLLNALEEKYGAQTIDEADKYAGGIDNYPSFPALNTKMASISAKFFADIEIKRIIDYKSYPTEEKIYADRSFFSTIIFQKYMKHLNIAGECSAYEYTKNYHFGILEQGKILLPDFFVYVKCKSLGIYGSRLSREISVDYLRSLEAKIFFESHFQKIYELYLTYSKSISVISDNTTANTEQNLIYISENTSHATELNVSEHYEILHKLKEIL
jgi:deoxyadenosine/deoxycytidine kinase